VESKGFIDGDLIESFLDLKPDKMAEVAKGVGVSVEELTKRIENVQQAIK
jgi:DNA damage-binding protein 1